MQGWKGFFVERHGLMASIATDVVNFVQLRSSFISLKIRDYGNAIEMFIIPDFEFKDVELFLFKPKSNVLINFAVLFYCINYLRVPHWGPFYAILGAQSTLVWMIALGDLVSGKEEEVLQVKIYAAELDEA
ncbi:hypothetical protein Ancab_013523 [Ancistrocladus abbreviatus]